MATKTSSSSSSSATTKSSFPKYPDVVTVFHGKQQGMDKPTAVCFIIHGLGDTAAGWVDVAEHLAGSAPHIKFILPTARSLPVTINGGAKMPSWYDIHGLALRAEEKADGLDETKSYITSLIQKEIDMGIPPNRIVLGGFSQGGAVSLWTGFSLDFPLAGIVCLSGYMLRPHEFIVSQKNVPLFIGHGTADDVVQFAMAKFTLEQLKEKGVTNIEFHKYPGMGHSILPEGIQDLYTFLLNVIPAISTGSNNKKDEV
jgi:predicted esterase